MRTHFEAAASTLIEFDPYCKYQHSGCGKSDAHVSAIDFSAGCGSTGVDLYWHPKREFKNILEDQRDELVK